MLAVGFSPAIVEVTVCCWIDRGIQVSRIVCLWYNVIYPCMGNLHCKTELRFVSTVDLVAPMVVVEQNIVQGLVLRGHVL